MSSSSSSSTGNRRAPRPKTPRPETPRPETPAAGRPNGTSTSDLAAVVPAVLLSAVTFSVLRYFVQPLFGPDEHYIDEEFHVPQARRYCRSEFRQWDPKITTLPGLYLLSATVLVPCTKIYNAMLSLIGISDDDGLGEYDPCSLFALRAVNAVGAPACLYYAYNRCQRLLSQNGKNQSPYKLWTNAITATSVATFPVIYAPYAMLYYTDAWATASVFLWYSSHLDKDAGAWLEVALGAFSVLCRQTNVAWIVFASAVDVCRCAERCFPDVKRRASAFSYVKACVTELYDCCAANHGNDVDKLTDFVRTCWRATGPNVVVVGSFVSFVVLLNGGDVVVGDRRAHAPRFHPMQLCYFALFASAFSLPRLLSRAYYQGPKSLAPFDAVAATAVRRSDVPTRIVSLMIATSALVYSNTVAHPYLLADNRHYTFYAWRLAFGPGKPAFVRYLPVPVYACGLYLMDAKLTRPSSIACQLAYWTVTALVLCPQHLLEPRYFVVPYLVYRLHGGDADDGTTDALKTAVVEFVAYQVCNFLVMWVFLYRPFVSTMDDTGRLDRFTW